MGISPRRLWGEEPKTRLIPDGEGGFIVEREPEFTQDDIDMFEAARLADESISPRGILYEDELNPENAKRFRAGDEKGLPLKNYATAAATVARNAYEKKYPKADTSDLMWPVRLVD